MNINVNELPLVNVLTDQPRAKGFCKDAGNNVYFDNGFSFSDVGTTLDTAANIISKAAADQAAGGKGALLGYGLAFATDTGTTYSYTANGLVPIGATVLLSSTNIAAQNTAIIQAALNNGGNVNLNGSGVFQINATLTIPSNTRLRLANSLTLQLAQNSNCNMLRNANWGSAQVLITSATYSAVNGSIPALLTFNCASNPFTVGQYVFCANANQDYYNGVFQVYSVTSTSFSVVFSKHNPADTITTPATVQNATLGGGSLVAYLADANITIEGGIWDYNQAQQTTPDNWQSHCLYLRRVRSLLIQNSSILNTIKYAIHAANCYQSGFEELLFATNSDGLHIGGSGAFITARNIRGKTGDYFVAITQGDYAQYVDSASQYVIGNFHDVTSDGLYPEQAFGIWELITQDGYVNNAITVRNGFGTFAGGAAAYSIGPDSNVKKQDGTTASTATTAVNNSVVFDNINNTQQSINPIIQINNVVRSKVSNSDFVMGAGSNAIAINLGGLTTSLATLNNTFSGGSNSIYCQTSGPAKAITHDNIYTSGGGYVQWQTSTAAANTRFNFNNMVGDHTTANLMGCSVGGSTVSCSNSDLNYATSVFFGAGSPAQIVANISNCILTGYTWSGGWNNSSAKFSPEFVLLGNSASSTFTPDSKLATTFTVTVTGAVTINAPTDIFSGNGQDGQEVGFYIVQDATGGRAITWNAAYKFPAGAWSNAGNTANLRSYVKFKFDGNASYVCISGVNSWY